MIIIPFFGDQPTNASWISSIGAGISFPVDNPVIPERKSLTPEKLEEAIKVVFRKQMREKVRVLSQEIKNFPGFLGIVDDIEKLISVN